MSNSNSIADFDIEFSLNEKLVLRKLQKIERALVNTNKKVTRSAQARAKAEVAAEKKAATAKKNITDKEQSAKLRAQAKEVARVKKFEAFKVAQFRSASFQKLTLEQKLNLKRVLSSTKAEHEIREEYMRTTALYKREAAQRAAYDRKAARKQKAVASKSGKGGIGGGSAMLALGLNPATATLAVGAAGGIALKKGSDQFDQLQASAATSGLTPAQLQERAFVAQSVGGDRFNLDKVTALFEDTNEKIGEALSQGEFKKGELTGGGTGGDFINAMIKQGVIDPNMASVEAYFEGLNPAERLDKILADTNKYVTDVDQRRFILESMASDLGHYNNALIQNQDKVKAVTETYNRLNIGMTEEETNRLKEFGMAMSSLGAVLQNFPLKLFSGFTESLSPETRQLIDKFAESLMKLAEPIGRLLGMIIDLTVKALSPFIFALEGLSNILTPVVDSLNMGKQMIEQVFANLFNSIMSMIPDWVIPDSWKADKPKAETTTNSVDTTTPTQTTWDVSKPYNMQPNVAAGYNPYANGYTTPPKPTTPPQPTMPPPIAQTAAAQSQNVSVKNDLTSNVNLVVDGKVLAEVVTKEESFKEGVNYQMYPLFAR
ncbi:hypothetical protein [Vibrio diazotrophicus]|uniref:hypothetical protein n=1 Tax=Vibrio diazotrophicus TaxID=685 RepID=UPI00142E21BE|nr:hypothetical protein [Vibrio diazotrophicus]NIY91979.1 hypothetical protein [Vibrio diazotrophicus]